MAKHSRIALAAATALSIFYLLVVSFVFWYHWFLPDPQYSVSSYSGIIQKEIMWGVQNFILEAIILCVPVYIMTRFFKKHLFFALIIVFCVSFLFTAREIVLDLNRWKPLEKVTHTMPDRTFDLGRTQFIPMKQYTVYFATPAFDLSFIQKDVLPGLQEFGYLPADFGVSVGGKSYTNILDPSPPSIRVQDINEIPFATPLQKREHAGINFKKDSIELYDSINFGTDNYEGTGVVKGMLRSPF